MASPNDNKPEIKDLRSEIDINSEIEIKLGDGRILKGEDAQKWVDDPSAFEKKEVEFEAVAIEDDVYLDSDLQITTYAEIVEDPKHDAEYVKSMASDFQQKQMHMIALAKLQQEEYAVERQHFYNEVAKIDEHLPSNEAEISAYLENISDSGASARLLRETAPTAYKAALNSISAYDLDSDLEAAGIDRSKITSTLRYELQTSGAHAKAIGGDEGKGMFREALTAQKNNILKGLGDPKVSLAISGAMLGATVLAASNPIGITIASLRFGSKLLQTEKGKKFSETVKKSGLNFLEKMGVPKALIQNVSEKIEVVNKAVEKTKDKVIQVLPKTLGGRIGVGAVAIGAIIVGANYEQLAGVALETAALAKDAAADINLEGALDAAGLSESDIGIGDPGYEEMMNREARGYEEITQENLERILNGDRGAADLTATEIETVKNLVEADAAVEALGTSYSIKPGDTLSEISEKMLMAQGIEDPSWTQISNTVNEIAEANNISDPDKIYPGQVLNLTEGFQPEKMELVGAIPNVSADTPIVSPDISAMASDLAAKAEELAVDANALAAATATAPVVEAPVVEAPVVEAPVVEAPAVETPAVETPVVETPVVETPVVETPVVETPAVETPAVETPAVETPAVEAPAVESPAVEAPAVESPAVESPVVETQGFVFADTPPEVVQSLASSFAQSNDPDALLMSQSFQNIVDSLQPPELEAITSDMDEFDRELTEGVNEEMMRQHEQAIAFKESGGLDRMMNHMVDSLNGAEAKQDIMAAAAAGDIEGVKAMTAGTGQTVIMETHTEVDGKIVQDSVEKTTVIDGVEVKEDTVEVKEEVVEVKEEVVEVKEEVVTQERGAEYLKTEDAPAHYDIPKDSYYYDADQISGKETTVSLNGVDQRMTVEAFREDLIEGDGPAPAGNAFQCGQKFERMLNSNFEFSGDGSADMVARGIASNFNLQNMSNSCHVDPDKINVVMENDEPSKGKSMGM